MVLWLYGGEKKEQEAERADIDGPDGHPISRFRHTPQRGNLKPHYTHVQCAWWIISLLPSATVAFD